MKTILFIIALFLSVFAFGQSLGLKTGVIAYKPFHYNKFVSHSLIGLTFKYSPKRFGIGIEPSIVTKSEYSTSIIITDNAGNKLPSTSNSKKITTVEVPVYVFIKAIDKDFKLNLETGLAFYGNTESMLGGFYSGYKIDKILLGVNYRINGTLSNQFSGAYQSMFISAQYTF